MAIAAVQVVVSHRPIQLVLACLPKEVVVAGAPIQNVGAIAAFCDIIAFATVENVIVAAARIPSPPALAVPVTNDGPATHPMPVCTIG